MQGIVRAQHIWYIFLMPIGFIVYMISGLAETNLTPFDLVEAESELIAGFTTEYSGMKFALFYLAEFAGNFTVGAIATTLFLGGWSMGGFIPGGWIWFFLKSIAIVLLLFHVRGTLPRVRVDQIMDLGWKFLIPAGLLQIVILALYVAVGLPGWLIFVLNVIVLLALLGLGGMAGVLKPGYGARQQVTMIHEEQRRKRALI
ncbi:MAG: NADH-quinone oxidoreductase subunit H [Chloroflexi bacterium]|nr:NADH-quinone oxidoreductase subunit H [Chloroflexota bacterium]